MISPIQACLAAAFLFLPLTAQAATPPSGDVPATPWVAAKFSFTGIVGDIATAKPSSGIGKINAATRVTFIELHMLSGYDSSALDFSADQQKALKALDNTIDRNRTLRVRLRKAGYLLSEVVAVSIDTAGNAYVFVNL